MKIKKGFSMRTVMGQNIVMADGSCADNYEKILVLNNTAALIWEMLAEGNFTPESAATMLATTFNVSPTQTRADVDEIINTLAAKGILDE